MRSRSANHARTEDHADRHPATRDAKRQRPRERLTHENERPFRKRRKHELDELVVGEHAIRRKRDVRHERAGGLQRFESTKQCSGPVETGEKYEARFVGHLVVALTPAAPRRRAPCQSKDT